MISVLIDQPIFWKRFNNGWTKGQSLFEVIIALAVAGLISLGLVATVTNSIKGARFSSSENQATALAQKRLSEIVNLRNTDWDTLWNIQYSPVATVVNEYCLLTVASDVTTSELPTTTPNYSLAKMLKINVEVFWDEKTSINPCSLTQRCGTGGTHDNYNHCLHFETYVTN